MLRFAEKCDAPLVIATRHMVNFDRYGVIRSENARVTAFEEKRPRDEGDINGGIYMVKRDLLRDMPVKFSFEKDFMERFVNEVAMYVYPSEGYFIDIGIPEAFFPAGMAALMEPGDVTAALSKKPRNAHKGMNGRLLIVAGSVGMAGAAALCAQSALRSGVGLVTLACPTSLIPIVQTLAPCAMALPLPKRDGAIAPEAVKALTPALASADAVVCGCGLSRRAAPEVLRLILQSDVPALLDADGLNLIAEHADLKALLRPHHLITPHPGEAARLLGRRLEDPLEDAPALRALGCAALLKGATTLIPTEDRVLLSASGGPGMAKGGSGDALSGLAGGLMAQCAAAGTPMTGDALALCAAVASEIHGRAGELAQARKGVRGMCAADLVEALPEALMEYEA